MNFGSIFETHNDLLLEAPGDEENNAGGDAAAGDSVPAPADNDAGGDNNDGGDTNTDDGGDGTANEDDANLDIDANDDLGNDDGGDNNSGGDTGGADTSSTSSTSSSGSGESPETKVDVDNNDKKKDRKIFATLSPQEQKIKTIKLKQLFMSLYDRCEQIIDKYDALGIEYEDLIVPIQKSLAALYSTKEMISTYLLYLFDSKSYEENDIMFNRMLATMNRIKLITKDMRDSHKKEIDDSNQSPLNDKDVEREKSRN